MAEAGRPGSRASDGQQQLQEPQPQPQPSSPQQPSSPLAERLSQLEVLQHTDLRGLVLDLVEENHQLQNRLGRLRRDRLLECTGAQLIGPPHPRPSTSGGHGEAAAAKAGQERAEELQERHSALVACVLEQDAIVGMQEQEISFLRKQLQTNDGHLDAQLRRRDVGQQRMDECREKTTLLLDRLGVGSAPSTAAPASPPTSLGSSLLRPTTASSSLPRPATASRPVTASRPASTERGPRSPMQADRTSLPSSARVAAAPGSPGTWRALRPGGTLRLTVLVMPGAHVKTASKVLLQVGAGDTPAEVKSRLAASGVACAPHGEQDATLAARLLYRGMTLAQGISLQAQGVADGSVLRLLPAELGKNRLRSLCDGRAWHSTHAEPALGPAGGSSATRGLLMNPGTRPWSAANPQLGPQELVQDEHTEKALLEAHGHHQTLFAHAPARTDT